MIIKKFIQLSLCLFFVFSSSDYLSGQNMITETFSNNNIPTSFENYEPLCNTGAQLSFTLPAGESVNVDSVVVSFDFQSSGFPPSAQQSQLYCQNSTGLSPVFGNTNGVPGNLISYYESGLTFANGVYAGSTVISIDMRAWRSFGSDPACGESEQFIVNNSWTVTLYHSDPYEAPKVGVNTTSPAATLDVNGKLKIGDDQIDAVEGMVKYDALNKEFLGHDGTDWKPFSSSTIIADSDDDTKINVEANADDDVIRLVSQDSMGWEIHRSNLKPINTNNSIYIGEGAGENVESAEANVALGNHALHTNVVAPGNVAIGDSALFTNGLGVTNPAFLSASSNTAIGSSTLVKNTTGFWNVAMGAQALHSSTTAQANTAVGYQSLYTNTTGGGNQAMGLQALFSNKTGRSNVAIGSSALYSNVSGLANVAIGLQNLQNNTANYNTSVGFQGMQNNTIGTNNAVLGYGALRSNTEGNQNTGLGMLALAQNTTGSNNAAVGYRALYNNTTGSNNIAMGVGALYSNTDRSELVAIGDSALYHNGIGTVTNGGAVYNTAVGSNSLYSNTDGFNNSAFGYKALNSNENASGNSAFGSRSLFSNNGGSNSAFGAGALFKNSNGAENTAIGNGALFNSEQSWNTAVGHYAMNAITNGTRNTAVGYYAVGYETNVYDNFTALGSGCRVTTSDQARIGNSSVNSIGGYAAWTNLSDARFKSNIQENVIGLDFIKKLKPVTYKFNQKALEAFQEKQTGRLDTSFWKSKYDHSKITQSGFLAQDVEAAAQSLGYDFNGVDAPTNEESHYGLRYSLFTVPLVKAVQELSQLVDTLEAALKTKDDQFSNLELELQKYINTQSAEMKIMRDEIKSLKEERDER